MSRLREMLPCFVSRRSKKQLLCYRRWKCFLVGIIIFTVIMINIVPWWFLISDGNMRYNGRKIINRWLTKYINYDTVVPEYNTSQIYRDLVVVSSLYSLKSSQSLPGVESVTIWELLAGQYRMYDRKISNSKLNNSHISNFGSHMDNQGHPNHNYIDDSDNTMLPLHPYVHYIRNDTDVYGRSSERKMKVCGNVIPRQIDIRSALLHSTPPSSPTSTSVKLKSILKKKIGKESSNILYPPLQKLLGETNRIGVKKEYLYTGDDTVARGPTGVPPRYAYVLMISNHKYIDGALVVGDSIRQHSKLVRDGKADLVVLISETIRLPAVEMLTRIFHKVKVVYTMAIFSPKSYYQTTFDKMYLFWMTEYEVVMLVDADSLIIGSPDFLFEEASMGHQSLTAVGAGDYFQTGLMIVKPNRELFTDLYLEYRLGGAALAKSLLKKHGNKNPSFTKEELTALNSYSYNRWAARDGILIRNCFMPYYKGIGHPTDAIYHFYGFVKPWFNKDIKYEKHSKGKDELDFNRRYKEWWDRYEAIHHKYFVPISVRDAAEVLMRRYSLSTNTTMRDKDNRGGAPQSDDTAVEEADKYYNEYLYGYSANFPSKTPIPGLAEAFEEARNVQGKSSLRTSLPLSLPPILKLDSLQGFDGALYGGGPRGWNELYTSQGQEVTPLMSQALLLQRILHPRKYMWMQRFSVGNEYFRPTKKRYAEIQNYSSPYSSLTPINVVSSSSLSQFPSQRAHPMKMQSSVASILFFPSYQTTTTEMGENTGRREILDDDHSVQEWGPPVGNTQLGALQPQSDGSLPKLVLRENLNKNDVKQIRDNIGFVIEGAPGQSCDDACSQYPPSLRNGSSKSTIYRCLEDSLTHTLVNDCFYSQWHISSLSSFTGLKSSSPSMRSSLSHFSSFSDYLRTLKRTILSSSSSEKNATIQSVAVAVNNILRYLKNRRCHQCVYEFGSSASPGVKETKILHKVSGVESVSPKDHTSNHKDTVNKDLYRDILLRKDSADNKDKYIALLWELVSMYIPADNANTDNDYIGISFREVSDKVLSLPFIPEGGHGGKGGSERIASSILRKCYANYLFQNTTIPSCDAVNEGLKRFCVCGRL